MFSEYIFFNYSSVHVIWSLSSKSNQLAPPPKRLSFLADITNPPHFSAPPLQPPVKETTFHQTINIQLIKKLWRTLFSYSIAIFLCDKLMLQSH